ncbi:MAG: efflux transporter periplasmic adaptor subunit, partial [Thiotrichaceae bacterium]
RIEVTNKDKTLYPGQFVKTHIDSQTTHDAMTVPAEAVLRGSDGDWMLFIEEAPGIFEPKEVDILEDLGSTLVINGLETGMTIVSKGAFTLQSELAKSGFSVHNH